MTSFKQCYTKLDGRSKLRKRKNTTRIMTVNSAYGTFGHMAFISPLTRLYISNESFRHCMISDSRSHRRLKNPIKLIF